MIRSKSIVGQSLRREPSRAEFRQADVRGENERGRVKSANGLRLSKALTGLLVLSVTNFSLSGAVLFTNLVSFDGTNAAIPEATLTQAADGNFYGTTFDGGPYHHNGTLFRLTPSGALTFLIFFDGTNGAHPVRSKLLQTEDGNLYGTTFYGGTSNLGTIFRATTNGEGTSLISFTGTNGPFPGAHPDSALMQAPDGNLYGATREGGTSNLGTIFRLTPAGDFTQLVTFTGPNGKFPESHLLWAGDNNLYGTTAIGGSNDAGTIFRMTLAGALTTLFSFNDTNGALPYGGLVLDRKGNFYGSTAFGGAADHGTIFRMTATGQFTSLFSFEDTNGASPYGRLTLGSDGNFYGTTYEGGTNNSGTVFEVTPQGKLTTMAYFTNILGPADGLTLGADGNLYGSTLSGGSYHKGAIFRLSVPMQPVFESEMQTNSVITLTWSAVAGQKYQLQSQADLGSPNWTDLGNAITATNGTVAVSEPWLTGTNQFYRAVLVP